ncbi:MAG: sugar ABC transporter ATP-binding protein [Eubacterium sp.]|nr:sugar ABC transporter ATP-binding protein [Eubacterium sp.]
MKQHITRLFPVAGIARGKAFVICHRMEVGKQMSEYRLRMENINKAFAGMQALSNAELLVRPGEAHALLGINGAGKSTMIKILSGMYSKDSGKIFINDKEVDINTTEDAIAAGVATVYQHPALVTSFTGYENIYLGSESKGRGIDRNKLKRDAIALAEKYNIPIDVTKLVSDMRPVEQELICILGALSKEASILILDEPTSILTEKEIKILFDVVRGLKKQDVSIIFVTHRLAEVSEICEEITVFRDGMNVKSLRVDEGLNASYIAEIMLGKKLEKLYPERKGGEPGEVVIEAKDICVPKRLENVHLTAKRNEILGVFGLVGSGIDELSKVLFGAIKPSGGQIFLNGKEVHFKSPKDGIKHGIFLIPGDRQTEGYVGDQSVASNLTMAKIGKVSGALGLIRTAQQKKVSKKMIDDLAIATPTEKKYVAELSGGNQQKVVVGKGLFTDADIYIFSEPTIGVDVGAKFSIYEIMRNLSETAVVILISSDIEEVFGMADRIMILNKGAVTGEGLASEFTLNSMLVSAV